MLCASLVATTVYNMNINPKKTKPLKPDHFVPKRKKKQSSEGQKKMARAIAGLLRGKVVD